MLCPDAALPRQYRPNKKYIAIDSLSHCVFFYCSFHRLQTRKRKVLVVVVVVVVVVLEVVSSLLNHINLFLFLMNRLSA